MPSQTSVDHVELTFGNAKALVALHGAHLYSWEIAGKEQLFLSGSSGPISGPAAIRGGVPICWPVFGPPPKEPPFDKLKQHGFARTSKWTFTGTQEDGNSVAGSFVLEPTDEIRQLYSPDFKLLFTVKLLAGSLMTALQVTNPSGSSPLRFQALLHTYLALPADSSPLHVKIRPLKGLKFVDKAAGGTEGVEDREAVGFEKGEVDRVYHNVPDALDVELGSGKRMLFKTQSLNNLTVWNPAKVKSDAMADMQAEGWQKFVCVEPGQTTFVVLPPGGQWLGSQTLTPRAVPKI